MIQPNVNSSTDVTMPSSPLSLKDVCNSDTEDNSCTSDSEDDSCMSDSEDLGIYKALISGSNYAPLEYFGDIAVTEDDVSPFSSKIHALLYMMLNSPRPIVSIIMHIHLYIPCTCHKVKRTSNLSFMQWSK